MKQALEKAESEIPVWRMLAMPPEETRRRATQWARELGTGDIRASESTMGGGSLPGESLPTHVLALSTAHPDAFLRRLRSLDPPIIARTEKGVVCFDPRTVQEDEQTGLLAAIRSTIAETQ